jgi:hypothetical protein
MQSLASLAAKLVIVAATGAGLYLATRYSDDRSVSNWASPAGSSDSKEATWSEPVRATSSSQQRLMADSGSCKNQTWPNISPECITGQAEPAIVAERPPVVPEQPSGILIRPTKLPEPVPDTEVTGSLPASDLAVRRAERSRVVKAKEAKKPKAEQRARAERRTVREAGRRNRSAPRITVAGRAASEPTERAAEPIQFRLAEGNR